MSKLITGARMPFFVTDIVNYYTLAAVDFSPIDDTPAIFSATEEDLYIKNGFMFYNATDNSGIAYVVTWNEFQIHRQQQNRALVTNAQVLALCTPVAVYLASGDWCMTPVVKVFNIQNGQYLSTVTMINIGTIR
jgi:hypothetical protein